MGKTFSKSKLRSRDVERELKIKRQGAKLANKQEGFLGRLARYAGAAFGEVVNFFSLDFDQLWDMMVEGYFAIKTFDWNATDKELEEQIKANNEALLVSAAEKIGEQLGFGIVRVANFFSGKASAAAQGIKVPVLSAKVGLALAEEQNDEAVGAVRQFLGQATGAMVSNGFLNSVLFMRRNELFGFSSISDENLPNGSIAEKIDEEIQKLPKAWQKPTEALIDGIEDGIVSAGYVVAFTIDDHIAAAQYAASDPGPTRTIEVKTKDGDVFEMTGGQSHIMKGLPVVAAQSGMLADKDVGTFFGDVPLEIHPLPSERMVRVRFRSEQFVQGKRKRRVYSTVLIHGAKPMVVPADLDGLSYKQGETRVQAVLKRSRRSVTVYASSENEGKKLVEQLVQQLSTDSIDPEAWSVSQGKSTGKKKKSSNRRVTAHKAVHVDNTKTDVKTLTIPASNAA